MRGLRLSIGAPLSVLLAIGCARFELTGSGGLGGDAPTGGNSSAGGAGPAGGGPVGGDPSTGGAPPCDEAKLESDPFNCGSCGHDCYGGDCIGATCQFEQIWSSAPDATNPFTQGIAIANDRVVWVCHAGTLSLETTAPSGTTPITHSTTPGTRVAFKEPLIYRTWGTLITTPITADVADDLPADPNPDDGTWGSGQCTYDIAIDEDGNSYCVNSVNGVANVFRYNASFSATEVASGLSGAFGVAVDDKYFYVGHDGGIWRQEKPPSALPGENFAVGNAAAQLTRVGTDIYLGTDDGLYRFDTVGELAYPIYPGVVPNSIYVDAEHIWFTNQADEQVWRVDLDGGNPRTWGIGSGRPDVIAGDDLFVFVTTDEDARVARLAK